MKTYITLLSLAIAVSGCTQKGTIKLTGDSTREVDDSFIETPADTLCFERYSGSRGQDTSSISIVLEDNRVTGKYATFPYEKDARIGTITGIRTGNIMKGMWHYQQEGMRDSLGFEWKIEDDKLMQKQTGFDPASGRERLSDTAQFSLEYQRIDCQSLNYRIR